MNWKRSVVAAVVAVPLIVLLARGMNRDPGAIPSPLPGKPAPQFALATMPRNAPGGSNAIEQPDSVRLSDHRGEVVVVNFWASWCLACRSEHAILSRVAERYRDRGVHFYGMLYNDTPENGARWIDEMGGQSYPTLLDPEARTAIDYGLYGVPETFFIDRTGRVVRKQVGPVTEEGLTAQLEAMLK